MAVSGSLLIESPELSLDMIDCDLRHSQCSLRYRNHEKTTVGINERGGEENILTMLKKSAFNNIW